MEREKYVEKWQYQTMRPRIESCENTIQTYQKMGPLILPREYCLVGKRVFAKTIIKMYQEKQTMMLPPEYCLVAEAVFRFRQNDRLT